MKAELTFNIVTDYIQTGFKELIKAGGEYEWKKGENRCIWTFPLRSVEKVENIIGHPIEFDKIFQLDYLKKRMDLPTEQGDIPEFKGKGEIVVTLLENIKKYEIIEYRKVENGNGEIEVKEMRHLLPQGLVDCMQDVLLSIDEKRYEDHKIGCQLIAKKMMDMLHIDRFNRPETGSFDWAKFFGNRGPYHNYYYLPIKILVSQGKIIHHKNGKITKIDPELFYPNGGDYNQQKLGGLET